MIPLDAARDRLDEARALADLSDALADGYLGVHHEAERWTQTAEAREMVRRIVSGPTVDGEGETR